MFCPWSEKLQGWKISQFLKVFELWVWTMDAFSLLIEEVWMVSRYLKLDARCLPVKRSILLDINAAEFDTRTRSRERKLWDNDQR